MITLYGYKKCSTVTKAKSFLDNLNIKYTHIDNVENKLSVEELKTILHNANVNKRKLFNTSGIKYRELKLKDKIDSMSDQEALQILSTDGMLVKRPLLLKNKDVLIGFKIKEWKEYFQNEQ